MKLSIKEIDALLETPFNLLSASELDALEQEKARLYNLKATSRNHYSRIDDIKYKLAIAGRIVVGTNDLLSEVQKIDLPRQNILDSADAVTTVMGKEKLAYIKLCRDKPFEVFHGVFQQKCPDHGSNELLIEFLSYDLSLTEGKHSSQGDPSMYFQLKESGFYKIQ